MACLVLASAGLIAAMAVLERPAPAPAETALQGASRRARRARRHPCRGNRRKSPGMPSATHCGRRRAARAWSTPCQALVIGIRRPGSRLPFSVPASVVRRARRIAGTW